MVIPFLPWGSPVLDPKTWRISRDYGKWLDQLRLAINGAAQQAGTPLNVATQAAALPATTLLTVPATGLYRVSNYVRITQAASGSSSLTVTIRFTDGGVACAFSGAAITTNTTTSVQTNLRLIRADMGTLITVETAYASVGIPVMQYALDVRVEAVP